MTQPIRIGDLLINKGIIQKKHLDFALQVQRVSGEKLGQVLTRVGLACCPADAVAEVQAACHWTIPVPGGHGVLRAVAEQVLKAQDHWEAVVAQAR